MKGQQKVQLAITEVITETLGMPVQVHLTPHQMTHQQRRQLCAPLDFKPAKKPRLLKSPCHIDISLRVDKFNRPTTKRSEAWLFIEEVVTVPELAAVGVLRIVEPLQPVSVEIGQPFQLCCTIDAFPEPEVLWYLDGAELPIDGERVKVSVIDGLKLVLDVAKAQLNDDGLYEVRVINSSGEDSSNTEVQVRAERPRFILPVEPSVAVLIGDDVALRCRAVGVPTPEVTWLVMPDEVGGVEVEVKLSLGRFGVEKSFGVEDGVEFVETTLKIDRVGVKDALMMWICRASNEVGDARSAAKVLAYSPARIVIPVPSTEVRRGQSVKMRCKAVGWPRPEVRWSFANRPLDGTPRLSVVDTVEGGLEEVESLIEVSQMSEEKVGFYMATASNAWGNDSCQAQLTVAPEAPDFTEKFHDKTIEEDTPLCLTARVSGIPFPSIKWLRNDVILTDSPECKVQQEEDMCRLIFERPRPDDTGRYSCVAENIAGVATCAARVIVKVKAVKPLIVRAPEDKVVVEQEKIRFEAEITGIPQPTVQWFKKDELLTETASVVYDQLGTVYTLTIDDAALSDDGPFSVTASNLVGEATATARLRVKERTQKPIVLKKPLDQEVTEGDDATFEVSVTGKPEPSVNWYFGNVLLKSTEHIRLSSAGTNMHSLSINATELHHAGTYTVKASNTDGEATAVANLTVNEKLIAPVFTEEMPDHEVFENESVLFSCAVQGKPLPRIKWFAGDIELFEDEQVKIDIEKSVSNGLRLHLSLRSASLNDAGEFKVVATNIAGTATCLSKLVVKMKTEKPSILEYLSDQTITEDDGCQFEISVTGKPIPTVQWLKDDCVIERSARIDWLDNRSKHVLTLNKSVMDDAGKYSVKIVNVAGEITTSANLVVLERHVPPVFTQKPVDQNVIENESVRFTCKARGKPLPVVSWYMNDALVEQSANAQLVQQTTDEKYEIEASLTLNSVALVNDSVIVKVKAENLAGTANTSARLNVEMRTEKPVLLRKPTDQEITEGDDGLFELELIGKPEPVVSWYFGSVLLKAGEHFHFGQTANSHQLSVRKAELQHAGPYTVKAVNLAGEVTTSASLIVNEKLLAPFFTDKTADQEVIENDPILLKYTVQGKPLPRVKWFNGDTELFSDGQIELKSDKLNETSLQLQLKVGSATLNDAGEVKVVATNIAGTATCSSTVVVKMRTEKPSVLKELNDQTITEEDNCYFETSVAGKPLPLVQWMKDGRVISRSSRINWIDDRTKHVLIINDATMDDAGRYSVTISNIAGEVTSSAGLVVLERHLPPVFTKRLADRNAVEENSVCFTCRAKGKPLPEITWYLNEQLVERSTSVELTHHTTEEREASLTLKSVSLDDSAIVKAVASSVAGKADTSARLSVEMRTEKPEFLERPKDQEVTEGEDGSFQVVVSGRPEPTVNWYFGNILLTPSNYFQVEKTGNIHRLSIRRAELHHGGTYTVKAMNVTGEVSAPAALKVNEKLIAPVFTEQMADLTVIEGEPVNFKCTVTGKPLPRIKWYKGEVEFFSDEHIKVDSILLHPNEVSLSLRLRSANLSDAGDYKAIATNVAGTASALSVLRVNERTEKPTVLKHLLDREITEDEDCSFETEVSGKPTPTVTWLKDDRLLEQSPRVSWSENRSKHTLSIRNAQLDDAGRYSVRIVNVVDEITSAAGLIVHEKLYPPVFSLKPVTQELLEDDVAEFHCIVEGKPLPTVSWMSGKKEWKPDDRTVLECVQQDLNNAVLAKLRVNQLTLNDAGEFLVIAKNVVGEATSSTRLSVKMRTVPPLFVKELHNQEITEEDYCSFEVEVTGKPDATVQWFKNDVEIKESDSDRIRIVSDASCHLLVIAKAQLSDNARYSIRAANIAGEKTSSATLVVNEKLWPPEFVEELSDVVDAVEEGPVRMNCRISAKPKPSIAWILNNKELKKGNRIEMTNVDEENNRLVASVLIDSSAIEDSGEVIVVATNEVGQAFSTAKLIVNVRTERPAFLKPLCDQEIIEEDNCRFETEISGKPVPEVHWYKSDKKLSPSASVDVIKDGSRHTLVLKKVALDGAGSYAVRAINMAGEIFASAILKVNERLHRPTFVEELKNLDTIEEDNVCFECLVEGKPLPGITWFVGGVEVKSGSRWRANHTRQSATLVSASLSVDLAAIEDSGEINAIAKNLAGEVVSTASLVVNMRTEKPLIVKGPVDVDAIEGDGSRFEATITGKPQPDVEWFRADRKLEPTDLVVMERAASVYSLRLPIVNLEHADRYIVKATNVAGVATAVATLSVAERQVAPTFTVTLSSQEAVEEDDVELECAVTGKPLPNLTWFKDDKEIAFANKVTLRSRQDLLKGLIETLRIEGLTMPDGGEIKVVAENTAGTAVSKTRLTVNMKTEKPVIVTSPSSQQIVEGQSCHFEVVVSGRPEPVVQWLKDGAKISSSPRYTIDGVAPKYSLTINESKQQDSGRLTVRAFNVAGEANASAELLVVEPEPDPYFNRMLEQVTVDEGTSASFECEVFPAKAKVTWIVDNVVVAIQTEIEPECDGLYRASADEQTGERRLTFIRATRKDAGCLVIVVVGELESRAELLVIASETEVCESRLRYEYEDDPTRRVAAEFECHHGDGLARVLKTPSATPTIEVRGLSNPEQLFASDTVQNPSKRRWLVRKAYVDRGAGHPGLVTVDRWSVHSYVDYTCGPEALTNVSLGILDDVKFTQQTVEFIIILSATVKAIDVTWLKDGHKVVPPSTLSDKVKYSPSVDASGTTHTMTVNDVNVDDEGIYTFVVRRPDGGEQRASRSSMKYHIEGSNQANTAVLLKALDERIKAAPGTSASKIGTGDR